MTTQARAAFMALLGGFLLALSQPAAAAEGKAELKVGDRAPAFKSVDDQGHPFTSADVVGKKIVVVYFYPADLTGGCTKQACGFRDDLSKLTEHGVAVIGVSGDSVENHQLFKKVHNLTFPLLADETGAVAKAFGVPTKTGGEVKYKDDEGKEHVLKRGVSAARWTFVIGKDGTIVHANHKVNAAGDSKAIQEVVEKLTK